MSKRVISAVLTLKDKDFSSNIKKAAKRSDDLGRGVAHVGNKIQRFGKTASAAFQNVAKKAATISFAGVTASATALSVGVGRSILEMDKSFSRLSAQTGLYGEKLKGMENVAKDVFKAGFGESISEVTNNVATLANMFDSLNQNELTNVAKGVSTIAELFDQDVKEVGKTVKGMVENFEGLTETKAMDLLTKTFQNTGDYANDLLDTFNEYSVSFSKLGISAEEFAGILSNASGAFNLDKVGDAVKELGIRVLDGSKTTIEGFEAIGLNADEMAEKFAAGGETANSAFLATLAGLAAMKDPLEQNAAGVNLFGTMFEDLREDVILSMADGVNSMQDFENATAIASEQMRNNISDRLLGAWRNLKLGIADVVATDEGKEFMDSLATTAENLVPKIQDLVQNALDFGNTIRDNWTPIKETIIGIGTAVGTFALLMGALKVVQGVTTLINGFRAAMQLATIGQWAMNTAMLASPFTWVAIGIAAVVAAGVLLYRNWDTVKKKASELWAKLQDNPLLALAAGPFGAIIGAVALLTKHFGSVKKVFNDFKTAISNFKVPKWVDTIGGTISGAASKVKNMLPSFDVGTNKVESDMTANIHKGEMIIPARQAERLRQQGVNIDNIDKVKGGGSGGDTTTTTVTNNNTSAKSNVNVNIYSNGTTTAQVIKEIVPQLKLVLANL